MNYRILCAYLVVALAVAAGSAQTKTTLSGKCDKPKVQQSISIPDQQGHMLTLAQGNCTATGDIGGAAGKDGVYSEHADVKGNQLRNWGVYVETLASGDKVFYDYQSTGTMKDGVFQSATNKYQISGGTGKVKGIKGSGTCKLTGAADGSSDYSCSGEYTLAGGSMSK
ncbi:MAG: hypothetical protein ABSD98_10145 [Candidatus Korobacteraceae bacterium]|jgi:hypothetical protein